jgi:hypothetical protein
MRHFRSGLEGDAALVHIHIDTSLEFRRSISGITLAMRYPWVRLFLV